MEREEDIARKIHVLKKAKMVTGRCWLIECFEILPYVRKKTWKRSLEIEQFRKTEYLKDDFGKRGCY